MDEQELERILQTATREVQTLGKVSDETAKQLAQAGSAMQRFKQATSQGSKDVLKGAKGFTKALSSGEASFDALLPVVEGLGSAISGLTQAVIPYAGDGLAKLGDAATDVAKFLVTRLGQAVGTFQKVSRTGGVASGGLDTLAERALQANLSLNGFGRLVTTNASALAKLEGSVFSGVDTFSGVTGQLTQNGQFAQSLRRLGLTAEEIGEMTGDFLTRQTRLGRAQQMDQNQLARASAQYVTELDQLSKLTGVQRKALADQQQQLLSETRFRARYEQISASMGEESAKRMMSFVQTLEAQSPQVAAAVKDIFATGGVPITDAGKQLMVLAGGQIQNVLDYVLGSQESMATSSATAADQLRQAIQPGAQSMLDIAAVTQDGSNVMTTAFAQILDFANNVKQTREAGESITNAQDAQINSINKLTGSAVSAQQALERYARAIDALTIQALDPTAKVVDEISNVMADLGLDLKDLTEKGELGDRVSDRLSLSMAQVGEMVVKKLVTPAIEPMADLGAKAGLGYMKTFQGILDVFGIGSNYMGGTVKANEISLVGERGPEIIAGPASVVSTTTSERILQNMTGPKSTYASPMSTNLSASVASATTESTVTSQADSKMDAQVDILKKQVSQLDQMIDILMKNNRIGERSYRSNLA
jgi:hypothetical protein